MTGNYEAMNMNFVTRILIEHAGVNPGRLMLDWVSASEGMRFSRLVTDFTDLIAQMGPVGKGNREMETDLQQNLQAALAVARQDKLRYLLGMFSTFTEKGNKYGETFTRHEMHRLIDGVVLDELAVNRMLLSMEEGPQSV
jgi:hypothetical protein